ncbi:hypothetical protein TrST_g2185 [Triparma strigata]|uniref:VWFA domain-containing protein n=1 Tax=Triparma strigata TaxID=1606541 RepID=A0A9W7F055_9STRA|nr:hypothetical protein TrST_g2185 [Triparma strigata]
MLLLCLLALLAPRALAVDWGGCQVLNGNPPANPVIDPAIHTCATNQTACDGKADVMFVMDGSGSITASAYQEAMDFLRELAMSFPMDDNLVNVGFVQYAGSSGFSTCDSVSGTCEADVLNTFKVQELTGSAPQICAALDMPYLGGGTPILLGLQVAHCALKGGRDVPKFIVFITDGQPGGADEPIIALAEQIRNESTTIFAITIVGGDEPLMAQIATPPASQHAFVSTDFPSLLQGNFTKRFVENIECVPPPPRNEPRCECWYKPDLLVCPLVQQALDYECGGGYGSFDYQCTQEQQDEENTMYVIFNVLTWVYKIVFVLALRLLFNCHTIDLGKRSFLCFDFVPNAYLFLFAVNLGLILATYLSRCYAPVWSVFFIIFLHIDIVVCLADRYMNRKLKAPPPVAPPRSNLELFAYTNNKKGWKEKAYNTVELRGAKKAESKLASGKKRYEKAQAQRKESIRKKGFSVKGAGLI